MDSGQTLTVKTHFKTHSVYQVFMIAFSQWLFLISQCAKHYQVFSSTRKLKCRGIVRVCDLELDILYWLRLKDSELTRWSFLNLAGINRKEVKVQNPSFSSTFLTRYSACSCGRDGLHDFFPITRRFQEKMSLICGRKS